MVYRCDKGNLKVGLTFVYEVILKTLSYIIV